MIQTTPRAPTSVCPQKSSTLVPTSTSSSLKTKPTSQMMLSSTTPTTKFDWILSNWKRILGEMVISMTPSSIRSEGHDCHSSCIRTWWWKTSCFVTIMAKKILGLSTCWRNCPSMNIAVEVYSQVWSEVTVHIGVQFDVDWNDPCGFDNFGIWYTLVSCAVILNQHQSTATLMLMAHLSGDFDPMAALLGQVIA